MLKTTIVAGALVLGVMVASPVGPARAGADVDIGIGLGGGYDDPGPEAQYWPAANRISCRQGVRVVRSAGFRGVRPVDCNGTEYAYQGFRRGGMYKITLKSRNGSIKDIDRIRRGGGGYGGGGYGDDYDDGYDDGGYGGGYDDGYDEEY